MLEVDGLSKSFRVAEPKWRWPRRRAVEVVADPRRDGRWFHAVRDVSFTAPSGAVLGLLGPNGAGKTTLMRVLATALVPTRGTARFDGIDLASDPTAVRRKLGFLSGDTGLYERLTPREVLRYFGRLYGMEERRLEDRVATLSATLGMSGFMERRCGALSTGMKQRVSIARALLHEPDVVIFDEPTTGLDVAAAETILNLVEQCRREGKTVILSTHHMHEVERLCDAVVLIHEGTTRFAGTVEAMREAGGGGALDRAFLALVGVKGDTGETGAIGATTEVSRG
jgi:sodium transport system ATP-binding protein